MEWKLPPIVPMETQFLAGTRNKKGLSRRQEPTRVTSQRLHPQLHLPRRGSAKPCPRDTFGTAAGRKDKRLSALWCQTECL